MKTQSFYDKVNGVWTDSFRDVSTHIETSSEIWACLAVYCADLTQTNSNHSISWSFTGTELIRMCNKIVSELSAGLFFDVLRTLCFNDNICT